MATTAVIEAQLIFRTLLTAMARPGLWKQLSIVERPPSDSSARWLMPVALTLIDNETTFAVTGATDEGASLAAALAQATSSRRVPSTEADYVFSIGAPSIETLAGLKRGLPAYPDESATLIVALQDHLESVEFELRGPGVDGVESCRLPGFNAALLACLRDVNGSHPLGVDLIALTAGGRVMALPRSTALTLFERSGGK